MRLDLSGRNFAGQDLRRLFLHRCNLRDTVWDGANLENADFSGSDLSGAWFRKCKMSLASLRGATLTGTRFAGAVTLDCDVFGANLDGARNLEFKTLKNLSAAQSPNLQPLVLKDPGITQLFGAQTAATYNQNGTPFLTVGTAATLPLTEWRTITRADLNAISQKCLNAEQWEAQSRAEWAAKAWETWQSIKTELLAAAGRHEYMTPATKDLE